MKQQVKTGRAVGILISALTLFVAGCSDELSPMTQMMLTKEGATHVYVAGMKHGHGFGDVPEGTKVRVVDDSGEGEYREVKVYVLEGLHKGETFEVSRNHLKAMSP
jgi:hypothetical protein